MLDVERCALNVAVQQMNEATEAAPAQIGDVDWGKFFASGNSYWLTRFIILRLLGFVYTIAFFVAARQLVPLIGRSGLTPAHDYLYNIHSQLGSRTEGMLQLPTLFWFGCTDQGMSTFAWVGF